jgi:hypothetical protein
MTNRAAALLPALLLAAAATTAHADDATVVAAAPAATAAGAPQNADWNDLSHLNGQLVKVGETNDYHKSYKRTNISTNPIGWMLGSYGVSVSYGLNDHIALRGDVNYISNYLDDDSTGMEVGVGAPIYFRRTYQGVFLEPGFISRRFESRDWCDFDCTSTTSTTVTTAGPQMLVGWHWTWDSGLNVAIAGGVGRNWASEDSYDKVFPNGYLRFGYAF